MHLFYLFQWKAQIQYLLKQYLRQYLFYKLNFIKKTHYTK